MTLRRDLILASLAAAWSAPGSGQAPARLPRIGLIGDQSAGEPRLEGFRQGLSQLGYVDGRNVVVDYRYAQGQVERFPALVTELLALQVDVLVLGADLAVRAAMAQTRSTPIVYAHASDPVGGGFAQSLARPGGNITGQAVLVVELVPKQMELLKAAVPKLERLAVLFGPGPTATMGDARAQQAGPMLGLQVQGFRAADRSEWTGAFERLKAWRAGAVLVVSNPTFGSNLPELAWLAAMHRVPTMYNRREFALAGGLLSYGANFTESYRRAAVQVDKILKGARPADLPVEQATQFELVVNLKTAKALGLAMAQSVLLRADEVIE